MQCHVDGAAIFAVTSGEADAPSILLLSGARCNTEMWTPVLDDLNTRFRVVRYDVRGTGHSQLDGEAPLGLDCHADDAAAVLDELGIQKCVVWGMAFGSRIALALASRHFNRVSALALYDASLETPDPAAQAESVRRAKERRVAIGMAQFRPDASYFDHDDHDSVAKVLHAAYEPGDHRRYGESIEVPTLIATGELDSNLAASRRLQRMIPRSELVVLEAVGHGSMLQRPHLCLRVLFQFLARHDSEINRPIAHDGSS
jgi:pimeloyl-ACP methyl ester carboxylesterase